MNLRITNGALDEWENEGAKSIVLRGSILPASLPALQVDRYQREVISEKDIKALAQAIHEGRRLPDIELGARTGSFKNAGEDFTVPAPIYIIDGFQRVTAARRELVDGREPRLGCLLHFNTDEKWERERFLILNLKRKPVAPSVNLRNIAFDSPVLRAIHALSQDPDCPLVDRVCWSQYMKRTELISAASYLRVIGGLHRRFATGLFDGNVVKLVTPLTEVMAKIGLAAIVDNVKTFFGVIEDIWGIKSIAYKNGALHMKGSFLSALALAFTEYDAFWRGNRLTVEASVRRKLSSFPLKDPQVQALMGGGRGLLLLRQYIVEHINYGKRTRRLVPNAQSDPYIGGRRVDVTTGA